MVSPSRRRDAVAYLRRRHPVSERRACQLVGQHRSTNRYRAAEPELTTRLVGRMNELAALHPRYGYRRIWALLRAEGFAINQKRIERLWCLEGHRVPPQRKSSGQKARGDSRGAPWARPATAPNDVWSYDFVHTRTRHGSPIRILNVVDEYSRVALGSRLEHSIGTAQVIEALEGLFERHGRPNTIRSDNGREVIAQSLAEWLAERGVGQTFIEKGNPQQNCYVERFNGTMCDELLNGESFHSVLEARVMVQRYLVEYNEIRPHRGLGMQTPAAFLEAAKVVRG